MIVLFAILFVLSQFELIVSTANSCKSRDYGKGSVVCVCDSSTCDTVPPIAPVASNEAVVFISDKGGRRFERTIVQKKKVLKTGDAVNITVDPAKKYQSIEGFGGCITDSAAINIKSLPDKLQDLIFSSYFSKDGIEYNILRVVISGCDGSIRAYSYDDVANDFNLTHFALVDEDLKYKIPVLQAAKKYATSPLLLFASSWSAPAWMKTNGRLNGNGSLKGEPKQGDPYYTTWANYYVKFLEEYAKQGITFWMLTAQNEPTVGFAEYKGWQTQRFSAEMQRDFIKYHLGPALQSSAFKNVSILIVDDNRQVLPSWVEIVMKDAEVAKYVSHVGVHYYGDLFVPPTVLDDVHKEFPNVPILATEASIMDRADPFVTLGSWDHAERYAHDVIQDLSHWCTGWVEWALAMDTAGGPSWANNHVSSPIVVNATSGEFYKQPTFYALGHFSKFITRGSYRIGLTVNAGSDLVESIGFKNAAGYVTVVLMNK